VVELGVAGVAVSVSNKGLINTQQEKLDLQQKSIDFLNEQLNFTEIAVQKLRHDFNILVDEISRHEKDFDEMKMKGPSTNYAISYITTKLIMGKQIIKEASRKWERKEVYFGLMDYLNLTLPCRERCPLDLASAKRCYMSPDKENLYMEMNIPQVNTDMRLVEADAFDLMVQVENKTCRVVYTGPKNAILSNLNGCPLALNIKITHIYDLVLSPQQGCMNGTRNETKNSHFVINYCYPQGSTDAADYIQIKLHHESLHIYCPENKITIDVHEQPCPEGVFILPLTATFKINDQKFIGSTVQLEHQETPDPLFTMRLNQYLKP